MKKFTLKFLVIFLIFLSEVQCQKWNSHNGKSESGRKTSRNGSYYSKETDGGKSAEIINSSSKSQATKPYSRGGIGAWGYVSIILFVILSGIGIYYTIIFYPVVCKKPTYYVMGTTIV